MSTDDQNKRPPTPITILTGFLGSGKTTIILNLLPQLPQNYKLALLKNEFGDLAIDSQLASSALVAAVRELLNGCICCNLVGQLGDALHALRSGKIRSDMESAEAAQGGENAENSETASSNGLGGHGGPPDRIVIETSGSAFPATLAMEVNRLARENPGAYVLDGVISVIDVENWQGYSDSSITAKMQARFTDMIILNKWEVAGEPRLDEVLDRLGDLESDTPRVKSSRGLVDKAVFLGIDGALASGLDQSAVAHEHSHSSSLSESHQSEVEVLSVTLQNQIPNEQVTSGVDVRCMEAKLLAVAPKDEVYRIKAVIYTSDSPQSSEREKVDSPSERGERQRYILNWAFGRWTYTRSPSASKDKEPCLRMTIVTAQYASTKWRKRIEGDGLIAAEQDSTACSVHVNRIF